MSLDRVIRWCDPEKAPERKQLRRVCEDFLGGTGRARWRGDRFLLDLPGHGSHPLRRLTKVPPGLEREERWIEVWQSSPPDSASVYVMTRQQDAFTNALAEGLAQEIARFWKGNREPM